MQRQQQYQYPTHSRYHNHNHPPRLHYAHDHHQLQQTTLKQPILVRYFSTNTQPLKPRRRYTRWILISSLGVGVGCYVIFKNLWPSDSSVDIQARPISKEWQIEAIKRFPFGLASRTWGVLSRTPIPEFLREPVYKAYGKAFGVNFDEAELPLKEYPTIAQFFTRRLKQGARPIDLDPTHMASPVDGKVIYFGEVEKDSLEQVKGIQYSLEKFMGPGEIIEEIVQYNQDLHLKTTTVLPEKNEDVLKEDLPQQVVIEVTKDLDKKSKKPVPRKLYHIGLYLAPGDYHGFHSPVDWIAHTRRHFPGYLFPVAPLSVHSIQGLFALNERVIITGKWRYGFFGYAPVGATNVGSIKLSFDKDLTTNKRGKLTRDGSIYHDKDFIESTHSKKGVELGKGQEIGFFHMGSTVVLIFEVPLDHDFHFTVKPGEKVVLGRSIGFVAPSIKR
eukprot:TRINITY_DN839_c0_g1_i1.p1 TRINITY_DN839_c0_g1~~TRINITY_DN839_c0_g1_i1.p1  ORF type:complete len:444 (-),score=86.24 TRINITY_DN839_c0_g1_i1:30-1361(-)